MQSQVCSSLNTSAKLSTTNLAGNLGECAACIGGAFTILEKHNEQDLCNLLRSKVEELAALELKAKVLGTALYKVERGYFEVSQQKREDFNFKTAISAEKEKAGQVQADGEQLRKTLVWSKWCEETGEEAEAADGIDDEGIEGIIGGEFKNRRCVLTQKDIFELEEPVQDSREWIWERRAIVDHINKNLRRGAGVCANPAQPAVSITIEELKDCSKRIKRGAQKQRRQQTQTQTPAEEIL